MRTSDLSLLDFESRRRHGAVTSALQFEGLLAEMVAAFAEVTTDKMDAQFPLWLERIGLAAGLERITVARVNPSSMVVSVTHRWARDGKGGVPSDGYLGKALGLLSGRMLAGEAVVFSNPQSLSEEATRYSALVGSKANVTVPVKIGGEIAGLVAFDSPSRERGWPDQLLRRLRLVAEIFGWALQRKQEVDELRWLRAAMTRLSRAAMMEELTASLAHELNQPLGAILGNAQAARQILAADSPDLDEVRDALDDIVSDNARAVDIIKWVRTLVRQGKSEKTRVEIAQVLQEVQRILLHDALTRNIVLRVDIIGPPAAVRGDKTELVQALLNLVNNAFDAASDDPRRPRAVLLTASTREGGDVSIAVRDWGNGISPPVTSRLFEPFVTTKKNGMGMGLAIVRSIVEEHRGRLRAVSNSDCGATFEITLPTFCESVAYKAPGREAKRGSQSATLR